VSRGKYYLPTLDGWRAIACSMVIICHGSISMGMPQLRDYFGVPGVDIFFGLSGFLITTLLLGQETRSGTVSLRSFYSRRVFRIIPAALLFLSVLWILRMFGLVEITTGRWVSALLFLANYSNAQQSWYVGHFWSLAVEEHFYLIWPATLLLVRSNRKRLALVLFAICFVDVWRMVDYKYHLTWSGSTDLWTHRTDIAADGILFGVAYALALADENTGSKLRKLLRSPFVLPLSIGIFVLTCVLPEHVGWKTSFLLLSLRSAVVPAMILATLSNPGSVVGRILEFKALRFVGLISYSLYLWQELFLPLEPLKGLTAIQWFPLNVALAVICAILSFYLVETPMIRLGQRLGGRKAKLVERTAAI